MKSAKFIVRSYLMLILVLLSVVACTARDASEEAPATENTVVPTSTVSPPPATLTAAPTVAPTSATTLEPTIADTVIEDVVIEGVLYAEALDPAAHDQLMDIFVPSDPGNYPVVIWAHGSNQDRTTGRTLGRILSGNGFVVMSIDWRDDQMPDSANYQLREAFEDAECALQMAASRAAEFGAAPDRVIWGGFSAGAWLGSMVSFSRGELSDLMEEFGSEIGNPPQQVVCVAAAAPAPIVAYVTSGGNFPSEIWLESAEEGEEAGDLAFFRQFVAIGQNPKLRVRIIQGNIDRLAPLDDTEAFFAALQEAGYDVAFFPQVGGHSPYYDIVIEQILAMIEE